MRYLCFISAALFFNSMLVSAKIVDCQEFIPGQDTTALKAKNDSLKKKMDGYNFRIGSEGIHISSEEQDSIRKTKTVTVQWGMLDLGVNALIDHTDYSSTAAQQYLQVPNAKKNANLFSLRPVKSINVNIWPVLMNVKLLRGTNQKVSFYTGAGLQLYNFRFNKDISYLNETKPMLIEDSVRFSKNKLAFAYASIPLMLNFKTRMGGGDIWLVYGFGVIGGYCFDSWTKQISDERGKQKNHDQFNFQKFNLNLSAELGIDNYIRLYGTYQVTNLYQNGLAQYPFALGIRFSGI